jgi:hypothetical protein
MAAAMIVQNDINKLYNPKSQRKIFGIIAALITVSVMSDVF